MNLKKMPARFKRIFVNSKAVLKDRNKKNVLRMLKEATIIAAKRRCLPTHYFSYFVYRKGTENYLDFISGKDANKIHRTLHNPVTLQILDNKLLFHEHFSKLGISVPKRIAYNLNRLWFIDKAKGLIREEVRTIEDFITLMRNLFQDSGSEALFAKPVRSSGGMGAIKISRKLLMSIQSENLRNLFHHLTSRSYIIQENVIQHPAMSRFNPSSLNTIRIDTFYSYESSAEIISALLRMGHSGSDIDNMMSGGMIIGIDVTSGKLRGNALTKLEHGGMIYSKHPESGIEFKDSIIPYFSEVKEMACQAANSLADELVGWDIGISTEGPVLIEGNGNYELQYLDALYGGYRRHPVFRKAMAKAGMKLS